MSTISASTTSTTGFKVTSDTTGTLVFQTGASPTTAMTLGSDQSVTFAGTPTYSGGTANGVAYLNGSKVFTTGSALVFDGTNLGVGTSSPACRADVNGMIRAQGATVSASGEGVELLYTNSTPYFGPTNTGVVQTYNRGSSAFTPMVISASQIYFGTGGNGRMLIDAAGNIGVRTVPSSWHSTTPTLQIGAFGLLTASTSSNYCNVGTNYYFNGSNNVYIGTGRSTLYSQNDGAHSWLTAASGTAGNTVSFTTAMNLSTSGVLTVGGSNPGGFLVVRGNGGTGASYTGNASAQFSDAIYDTFYISHDSSAYTYLANTGGRIYVKAANNAGVYIASGATSWTSASDERVKDIIEPIENATEKLAGLRTVIGKYKTDEDGIRRSFLIAQDVQAVFPEAVDATSEDELGVRYTDVIPLLAAAIKEQQAIIETLTNRITALEAK